MTSTLVVISGPPGSGKTTLAHAMARTMGCPAALREIVAFAKGESA